MSPLLGVSDIRGVVEAVRFGAAAAFQPGPPEGVAGPTERGRTNP
jgi:hypothetical protein